MKVLADQDLGVGTGIVGAPDDLAGFSSSAVTQPRTPISPPLLPMRIFALDDKRRHGDGLALVDVAELGVPDLLAGLGVDGDGVIVERVEEDLAVVVGEPAA